MTSAGRQTHSSGVRIDLAIGLVVLVCGLSGLVLTAVLAIAWQRVDAQATRLSEASTAAGDLVRLMDEMDEWAVGVDLTLGDGQTWFVSDMERTAERIHELLHRHEWSELRSLRPSVESYLEGELQRLQSAARAHGDTRASTLQALLLESDAALSPLLAQVYDTVQTIQQRRGVRREALTSARAALTTVTWLAGALYLGVVLLAWRWAVASITRPLAQLAEATHVALETGDSLRVCAGGPREVQALSGSILALTGRLEGLVEQRTGELERMATVRKVILDVVPVPLAHIGADGVLLGCNEACSRFFGVADEAAVLGRPARKTPLGTLLDADGQELSITNGAGTDRTVHVSSAHIPSSGGGQAGLVLCFVDVTERVEHATRLRDMLRELDHRVKNTLAAILSLVDRMVTESVDLETFRSTFTGRVVSMARAHELLAESQWRGVDLSEAVKVILAAWMEEGTLAASGPSVRLHPSAATPVCMMLNELATNAAKHGAWSCEGGRVDLHWAMSNGSVRLDWAEHGGPALAGPPERRNTGLDLLEGFLEYQLHGELKLDWPATGLVCSMTIPV